MSQTYKVYKSQIRMYFSKFLMNDGFENPHDGEMITHNAILRVLWLMYHLSNNLKF